ncbi:MAG: hypothetical protein BGN95_03150 [Sphingomonas sp. 66-10]|jgi:hypothetical protein|uniref:hypothetical protein n=1 Tax=Sphingomonas sp. 66-10 TaxID=1895848 RepID=UPI0009279904|nr:hypothetical protein [Sphingomonas sp. 66-10]OJU15111.1 MAG: hypothetical protein BGN95_03150 [Sphingomonas sp. 66-10]
MEEEVIKQRVLALVTDWAAFRHPPFTGEKTAEFVDAISVAHLVAEEAKSNLRQWVLIARRAGVSWLDIGGALGISKQAAQQRYGSTSTDKDPPRKSARGIFSLKAGSMQEMTILHREGRRGHELIDATKSELSFKRTRKTWEYRKVIFSSLEIHRMMKEDWMHVSDVFPFSYFKRSAR